jgi:hypothetical protein
MSIFTFKPMEQSVFECMAHFSGRTGIQPDATPGSIIRTLFEAVGFQIEDASYRFDQGIQAAIPRAVFEAFDFQALVATPATAPIVFVRAVATVNPVIIPPGTFVARADGFEFQTTSEITIPAGAVSGAGSVIARTPSAAGNSPANTIEFLRGSIPTVIAVTNPAPATGGQDTETLASQKARFALFIASIHRATRAAIAAAVLGVSADGARAREVLVIDKVINDNLLPAVVHVYIDDGFGTTSPELLAAAEAIVYTYAAAGAVPTVYAVLPQAVNVTYSVDGDEEAVALAGNAAAEYLLSLRIGEKVSRENLITAMTNAAQEEITLTQPAMDIEINPYSRATPGTISGSIT